MTPIKMKFPLLKTLAVPRPFHLIRTAGKN